MSFVVQVIKGGMEVLHIGEFEKKHHAVACARRAIDLFLLKAYSIGMSPDKLLQVYTKLGEHPVIFQDGDDTVNVPFSHLNYAIIRCEAICGAEVEDVR